MPQPTKRNRATKPTDTPSASLYARCESAIQAKRLTAEQAFTLLKIERTLLAEPDGAFAELLVGMLSQSAESAEPMTDAEYAQAAEFGTEVARNA